MQPEQKEPALEEQSLLPYIGPDMETLRQILRSQRGEPCPQKAQESTPTTEVPVTGIPKDLMEQLVRDRAALEVQGSIQRRDSGPGKRLRFRVEVDDVRKHRSIALANELVAEAVWNQILQWRTKVEEAESERWHAEDRKRAERKEMEELRRIAINASGGGRRRRKQISDWFHEIQKDRKALFRFIICPVLPPPRRAGRPPKSAAALVGGMNGAGLNRENTASF